jgi:hypothetical protein
MALNVNQKLLALFLLAFLSGSSAQAESIVAGSTALPGTAIMDLLLEPNTPFNPTESPITLSGVSGVGSITINRDAQVGNTINIPTLAGGMFFGSNAILGSYVFGNIAPLTGADFSGTPTTRASRPVNLRASNPGPSRSAETALGLSSSHQARFSLSSCSLTQPCLSASPQTLTVYPHQTERSS